MFSGTEFYFQTLTKYIATFGSLFANITISRTDPDGNITQKFKVPLQFGPKEKMLTRLRSDPDLDREYSALLPVISFELVPGGCLNYNPERKLTSTHRKVLKIPGDKNKFKIQYNPVPYDIFFNLYIYAKNIEDGHKILEQILPAFTPNYTVSMDIIPEMNDRRDIPILIKGNPSLEDSYDEKYETRRRIVWTIPFVMHGIFYGPIAPKPIIKFISINARLANESIDTLVTANTIPALSNDNPIVSVVTQYPGMYANGQPSTDPNDTVEWHQIDVDDNWGFITVVNNAISNT